MKTILLIASLLALGQANAAPTNTPAIVSKEGDLTTILLKPEAEQRLRLKLATIERRAMPSVRQFSGETILSLAPPSGGPAPIIGGTLDEWLRVTELQAIADGRLRQAHVQREAAQIAQKRAERMLKAEAGSVRVLDEANAALASAEASMITAQAQRDILGEPIGKSRNSPRSWVRVAIYGVEASLLDPKASARIRPTAAEAGLKAQPVAGPATANAITHTVDWYYALPADHALRPGERVAVEIPARDGTDLRLVVPFAAVLHDIHGGQWIYEQIADHAYARRRVQVARIADGFAILASGPPVGTKVVTDGAAELFGTEFVTGK